MEHVAALAVRVAAADSVDLDELADLAACTFPLACPPSVTPANVAAFVGAHLSATRFAEYLADPGRMILTAAYGARLIGYAMLIHDDGRSAVELSKMYVLAENHGTGVSSALMDAALMAAREFAATYVWLGVNQKNQRAQRFYAKHGFAITGTRTFQVGTNLEHDYIMAREL